MKKTTLSMGMPITVAIVGKNNASELIEGIFDHFAAVDARFSTYRHDSEISRINRGELAPSQWSPEMQEVFLRAEDTRKTTDGYFSIEKPDGTYDPSGLVKGWAIQKAADMLRARGVENFFIDAGGDISMSGTNEDGEPWSVGIRNPFNREEIVKVLHPHGKGVATSGTYIRGRHIWNPDTGEAVETPYVSLTVLGNNVYDADRFATAAFAMGEFGMHFIEMQPGLEAYAIDKNGRAVMTSGFEQHV